MYGPKNTAADVAFLLEEGLRTGTVSLHDEKQNVETKLRQMRWVVWVARAVMVVVLTVAVISVGHFLIDPAGLASVKGILGILLCAFLVFLYGSLSVVLAKVRTPFKS